MAICAVHTSTQFNPTCSSISTPSKSHLGFCQRQQVVFYTKRTSKRSSTPYVGLIACAAGNQETVVIGLAADSGCGKSTFMRRLTSVFGGAAEPPKGGNPDSNTLISDTTTVICLDDYHSLDRTGRKEKGVTALDPRANDFDLMYEQVKAIKDGKAVDKPIYNHVSGLLDPPELIKPPKILVIEGLHPMYDQRVRDLLDFSIYLDISNEVKFAWKIQRDMAERGHSLESIKASIEARKPDFDAYIDPQKQYADAVIEVLPTQLIPGDNEGKVLRVRLIMKEGVKFFNPVYLFDEGSTISWIPCGRKLTCSYPGIKFTYGPDTYYGQEVSVLEMDGHRIMAFLLKSSVASHFRQTTKNDSLSLTRRQFHVEPGAREKALLAADPSLRRFKSHKKGVMAIKRLREVLTVVVIAGCCYEIGVKAMMREEARAQAKA